MARGAGRIRAAFRCRSRGGSARRPGRCGRLSPARNHGSVTRRRAGALNLRACARRASSRSADRTIGARRKPGFKHREIVVFQFCANLFGAERATRRFCRCRHPHRGMAHRRTALPIQRYVAARDEHRLVDRDLPDGVRHPEHPEPAHRGAPDQARRDHPRDLGRTRHAPRPRGIGRRRARRGAGAVRVHGARSAPQARPEARARQARPVADSDGSGRLDRHMLVDGVDHLLRRFGVRFGSAVQNLLHALGIEFLAPLADHNGRHAVADQIR